MDSEPKCIVLLSYKFPPVNSGYGNQALSVIQLITSISERISFIVLTGKFETKAKTVNYKNASIKYIWNNVCKVPPDETNIFNSLSYQLQAFLWLILNCQRYSMIHCIASGPHFALPIIAGKLLKKKTIIKIANVCFFDFLEYFKINSVGEKHGTTQQNIFENFFHRPVERLFQVLWKIVSHSDVFIALSERIYTLLYSRSISPEKIVHIPNGVDNQIFYPANSSKDILQIRRSLDLDPNSIIILYAGVLSHVKGVTDLLRAMVGINLSSKTTLVLCGADGGCGADISKFISTSPFHDNLIITYRGHVSNVASYFRASDIFVLPSYMEGLPNVLLEASMCGLPLIATDIGGNRDIIRHNYSGFLYPPGDIRKLRQTLSTMIDSPDLRSRMGKEARRIAMEKYSLRAVAHSYIQLYNNM